MPAQPTDLPRWATDVGATVEPPSGEKDTGWVVDTKPPARKMNWILNKLYEWMQYLQSPVGTGAGAGVDATGGPTDGSGLKGTGGGTDGRGVEGVGKGTAAGLDGTAADNVNGVAVKATGPASGGGTAVDASATTTGKAVKGVSVDGSAVEGTATGTGNGVHGVSANGHGVAAIGDTTTPTKSSLYIGPQDTDPTTKDKGSSIIHSVTGGLRVADGTDFRKVLRNLAHLETSAAVTGTSEAAFNKSFTIPAGILTVGDSLRLVANVNITSIAGGGALDLRVRINGLGSGVISQRAIATPAISINRFEITMVVVSIGAGGTMRCLTTGTNDAVPQEVFFFNALPTVNTTGTNNLVVTADWASAGNSCHLWDYVLDIAS